MEGFLTKWSCSKSLDITTIEKGNCLTNTWEKMCENRIFDDI